MLKRIKDFPATDGHGGRDHGHLCTQSPHHQWRDLSAPTQIHGAECQREDQRMLSSDMEDWKGIIDDTMRGCKKIAINRPIWRRPKMGVEKSILLLLISSY
ncbi:hypothetical protein CLCR_05279 [Cladophialophora carrionii]|uniref:Uncharacterized protein n=1 Tax=Cladophialophora carrionii TaxID=86049 RepID=A0A1C1CJR7_9EURO|nr:hypothetical protein CLCR_05279 [Cladophialophora carrionii]